MLTLCVAFALLGMIEGRMLLLLSHSKDKSRRMRRAYLRAARADQKISAYMEE